MLIVRLYKRLTPRQIGLVGFILVAVGLVLLAFAIRNVWGTPLVILGLVVLGLGEGALITLLFNVLVSSSPKSLAGDVGALRGTANNLGTAIGTATAATLSVGLLAFFVLGSLVGNQLIPADLQTQVNLDNINFISNDQLLETLSNTTATTEQVDEAVRINVEARLRALKATFLILAALALLAVLPALGLPKYVAGDIPRRNPMAPRFRHPRRRSVRSLCVMLMSHEEEWTTLMQIDFKSGDVLDSDSRMSVLAVFEGEPLPPRIADLLEPADFRGRAQETLLLYPSWQSGASTSVLDGARAPRTKSAPKLVRAGGHRRATGTEAADRSRHGGRRRRAAPIPRRIRASLRRRD